MADYPIPTRLFAFAAKVEASRGVAETISWSTDAIRLLDVPTIEPILLSPNTRPNAATGSLDPAPPAQPSGKGWRIRGQFVPFGPGTAYAANNLPECDPLLIAAGMTRTVVATPGNERVTYTPTDNPQGATNSTVTAVLEKDNKKYQLTAGVIEELTIECDAGGFPVASFSLVGIATDPAEQALEAATYDSITGAAYPLWAGMDALKIGAVTGLAPRRVVADWGLNVVELPNANIPGGHGGYKTVARNPMLTITAQTLPLSSWNPWDEMASATPSAIDVAFGTTQYRKVALDADYAQPEPPDGVSETDLNGVMGYEVRYLCAKSGSGAVLNIVFS